MTCARDDDYLGDNTQRKCLLVRLKPRARKNCACECVRGAVYCLHPAELSMMIVPLRALCTVLCGLTFAASTLLCVNLWTGPVHALILPTCTCSCEMICFVLFLMCLETGASWCNPVLSRLREGQHPQRKRQRSHSSSSELQTRMWARKSDNTQTLHIASTRKNVQTFSHHHAAAHRSTDEETLTQACTTNGVVPAHRSARAEEPASSHSSTLRSASDKAKTGHWRCLLRHFWRTSLRLSILFARLFVVIRVAFFLWHPSFPTGFLPCIHLGGGR